MKLTTVVTCFTAGWHLKEELIFYFNFYKKTSINGFKFKYVIVLFFTKTL